MYFTYNKLIIMFKHLCVTESMIRYILTLHFITNYVFLSLYFVKY